MSTNFPKNEAELRSRLAVIERGLPNQGDNFNPFAVPAFRLFVDCGLNNHDVISELTMKSACDRLFGCTMNPLGGVLRHQDLPMFDASGHLRYYSQGFTLYLTLECVRYYVSNHWLEQNKRRFFMWLKAKTTQTCRKYWAQNKTTSIIDQSKISGLLQPKTLINSQSNQSPTLNVEKLFQTLLGKIEEMEKIDSAMCYLIPNLETQVKQLQIQADRMEKKIDKLVAQVDELHRELFN